MTEKSYPLEIKPCELCGAKEIHHTAHECRELLFIQLSALQTTNAAILSRTEQAERLLSEWILLTHITPITQYNLGLRKRTEVFLGIFHPKEKKNG